MRFRDRKEAGQKLAEALSAYRDKRNVIVLALPRGGVPVAYEVARALRLPLDLMLVRKLGVPGHEEFAMGAMAIGNVFAFNEDVVRRLAIPRSEIDKVIAAERIELNRRNNVYRGGKPAPELADRTVILVDDGLATGATMQAAVSAVMRQHAARIVVAVPVGSHEACEALRREVDEVVCLATPEPFYGVGQWYRDFGQTSDEEVVALLKEPSWEKQTESQPG